MNSGPKQHWNILLYAVTFVLAFGIGGSSQQITSFKKAPLMTRQIPFNHSRVEHKQECSSCHIRIDNDPVPQFPYHTGCIGCHVSDFMNETSKLCLTCHVTPLEEVITPNALTTVRMINFPKEMEEFGLKSFSHRDHLDASRMPRDISLPQCSSCHTFDSQELAASIPKHPECYSCHDHQPDGKLGACRTCHAFKNESLAYKDGPAGAFYLFKFRHSAHFASDQIGRNCAKCHTIKTERTMPDIVLIKTDQDDVLHNTSCWASGCHTDNSRKELKCLERCHMRGTSWPPTLPKPWTW